MSRTTRIRFLIVPLLLLQFWAAVWMAFNLPAHATPNELLNYEYIAVMRQIRGLPNRGLVDSEIRYTEWHQPPVYFTLAALVGLPLPVPRSPVNPPPPIEVEENPHYLATPQGNRNPVVHITPQSTPLLYTSRLAAALLGLVGVAALYRAGAQILATSVGLLMASLLAFQPGYIHLSGSVNNDMPLTAVVAIVMAYSLLLLARQERRPDDPPRAIAYVVLGLLGVAAILTKANGVFVLAFLAVVLLSSLLVYRRWGLTIKYGLATLVGLVPLWAAWLVLNSIRMRDALGLEGSLPVGQVLTLSPLDFVHLGPWLGPIWRSYWLDWSAGDVGYGPDWLYLFWAVALAIMLLGWLAPARSPSTGGVTRRWSLVTPLVLLGFLGISYLYFAVKALTVREAGFLVPEARWWLPGLPALAWLAAAGFARWWRTPHRRDIACLSAALVPPAILLGLILFHFPTLYPEAQLVDAVDPAAALPSPISYEGGLSLIGLQTGEMAPGEPVPLALTWQADTRSGDRPDGGGSTAGSRARRLAEAGRGQQLSGQRPFAHARLARGLSRRGYAGSCQQRRSWRGRSRRPSRCRFATVPQRRRPHETASRSTCRWRARLLFGHLRRPSPPPLWKPLPVRRPHPTQSGRAG